MLLVLVGGVVSANADNYLGGSWKIISDSWAYDSDTKFSFEGEWGTLTLNLAASTTYYFNLKSTDNGDKYWSNAAAGSMNSSDCSNWTLYENGGGSSITTTAAGDYIFKVKWIDNKPHLWVIYPTSEVYVVHFQNVDNWESVYAHRYTTRSYVNNGTQDFPYTAWHGTNITSYVNSNNSGYYDLTFSDTFEKVIFNNGDQLQTTSLTIDFNSKEYWVTKTNNTWTISKSAPEGWVGHTRGSLTPGNLGTICLPFNATVTGATIYMIVGKTVDESGNLTGIYAEPVTNLVAGHAYLFKATDTSLTATYSGSYSAASEADGMLGNLSSTTLTVTSGYVISGGKIRKLNGGSANIGQYKAYITLNGINTGAPTQSAPGLTLIDCDENATGIEGLEIENSQDAIYDMQGRQVKDVKKGLYIINGKKVLVK